MTPCEHERRDYWTTRFMICRRAAAGAAVAAAAGVTLSIHPQMGLAGGGGSGGDGCKKLRTLVSVMHGTKGQMSWAGQTDPSCFSRSFYCFHLTLHKCHNLHEKRLLVLLLTDTTRTLFPRS